MAGLEGKIHLPHSTQHGLVRYMCNPKNDFVAPVSRSSQGFGRVLKELDRILVASTRPIALHTHRDSKEAVSARGGQ